MAVSDYNIADRWFCCEHTLTRSPSALMPNIHCMCCILYNIVSHGAGIHIFTARFHRFKGMTSPCIRYAELCPNIPKGRSSKYCITLTEKIDVPLNNLTVMTGKHQLHERQPHVQGPCTGTVSDSLTVNHLYVVTTHSARLRVHCYAQVPRLSSSVTSATFN